jgi:hypothetical protein
MSINSTRATLVSSGEGIRVSLLWARLCGRGFATAPAAPRTAR